jgi:ubiquinone/menaquinone biosynthesis C-methylase UbiE
MRLTSSKRAIIDGIFGPLTYKSNKDTWESEDLVKVYSTRTYLQKPEETILNGLRSRLSDVRMLDIGVGAGRTTHFFAHLTKEYVGIDYSENMIKACRKRFRNNPKKASFQVGDARALRSFEKGYFDFVLFSYNGLDCMNHEDRLRALCEMRRVTRKGGHFCFSTHNLNFAWELFLFRPSRNPVKLLYETRRFFLLRLLNNNVLKEMRNKRYAILNDGEHSFRLRLYYIKPKEQIRQLTDLGFTNIKTYGSLDGGEIKDPYESESAMDPWLYYLCDVG